MLQADNVMSNTYFFMQKQTTFPEVLSVEHKWNTTFKQLEDADWDFLQYIAGLG